MIKKSFYNFTYEHSDGYLLLYNTFTGAFIAVEPKTKQVVKNILLSPNEIEKSTEKDILLQQGFLIDDSFNEIAQIKSRFEYFKNNNNLISFTILPTENCNFKCPYCFIYDRRGLVMQSCVYEGIFNRIKKVIKPGLKLTLNWFGGEPTLEKKAILSFMGKVQTLFKEYPESKLYSTIVTNGYLLDSKTFRDFLRSGISIYQVTLDGNEITHNKTRMLKDGSGTFKRIVNNLKDIKNSLNKDDDFEFMIRVNFLKDQDKEVDEIINLFKKIFGEDKRFHIYFRAVYDIETCRQDSQNISSQIYQAVNGIKKQADYYLQASEEIGRLENTLPIVSPVPNPIPGWCSAQRVHSYIIGADGTVSKCETYIGKSDKSSGKINKNGEIEEINTSEEWNESIFDNPKYTVCMECKFLPICQGGCPRGRQERVEKHLCFYNEELIKHGMISTHLFNKNHSKTKEK